MDRAIYCYIQLRSGTDDRILISVARDSSVGQFRLPDGVLCGFFNPASFHDFSNSLFTFSFFLSFFLSFLLYLFYLFIYLFIYLLTYLFIYLFIIYLYIYIYLFIYLFIY